MKRHKSATQSVAGIIEARRLQDGVANFRSNCYALSLVIVHVFFTFLSGSAAVAFRRVNFYTTLTGNLNFLILLRALLSYCFTILAYISSNIGDSIKATFVSLLACLNFLRALLS